MNFRFTRSFVFTVMLFCYQNASAQDFNNNSGEREKHFIYTVWQIDEFFNRFNNDPNSFVREIYKTYNVKFKVDRKKLIKSLFNYDTKKWSPELIDAFTDKAVQVKLPSGENWFGENWYAEAICRFQYNGTVIDIPLVLKTFTDNKKRSKWVITGIRSNPLKPGDNSMEPAKINPVKTKFIDPSGHGTRFIELEQKFSDKENLSDYFDNVFFTRKNGLTFYNALLNNKIRFLYVNEVKYHFLNVENYLFTVEYFQRESLNAGWLINDCRIMDNKGKEIFKKNLLGE